MTGLRSDWATQQLVEFLVVVSACRDRTTAIGAAVERAAEALEADAGVAIDGGVLVAATGFGSDDVPASVVEAAKGDRGSIELPWNLACGFLTAEVGYAGRLRLLLARDGAEDFSASEVALLRGMARLLDQSLRMLELLVAERTLREREEAHAQAKEVLLGSLRHRQRLLERLARIQRSLVYRTPLPDVLEAIVDGAQEMLGADVVGLRLVDEQDPETMLLVAHRGLEREILEGVHRLPVTAGAGGRAMVEDRVIEVEDYASYGSAVDVITRDGVRSVLAAPVHENGRVVGSLAVAGRTERGRYRSEERDVLLAFAEHASLALTDARNFEDALHLALHDGLTKLPNRRLFLDRLGHALSRSSRNGPAPSVLFLDIDNFKTVNDSLGHGAGDELLRGIAARLDRCLRPGDTAARFGGDEFALLLEDSDLDAARTVADRILAALEQPFEIEGNELRTSASIGIVQGQTAPEDLLRDADLAMYRAKAQGRSRYEVFEASMRDALVERVAMIAAMRHAVDRDQLRLQYQPVVELETGEVTGFEALVRWEHPERGLLAPISFISIAEETRMIVPIGRWVMREACRQAAQWRSAPGCSYRGGVAVNLSAEQLTDDGLLDDVRAALEDSGLPPEALTFEITETVLMADTEPTIARLRAFKRLGVQLAVDDFGTGYSSLQYLHKFPIDVLKIAKPFVDGLTEDTTLPQAILDLAGGFALRVVAEGVESEAQRQVLIDLGCQLGQGYLFARPLDQGAATALLNRTGSHAPMAKSVPLTRPGHRGSVAL